MSREERSDVEQLDGIARELAEAGNLARMAGARLARPDPAFAMRLRAELMRELAASPGATAPAEEQEDAWLPLSSVTPVPPDRPLNARERFVDRRPFGRPHAVRREESGVPELLDAAAIGRAMAPEDKSRRTRAGRRWQADAVAPITSDDLLVSDRGAENAAGDDGGRVAALRPSVRWHIPSRVPMRYLAAGMAACLVVATFLYSSTISWPVRAPSTANEAVAATLVRAGTPSTLVAGTELHEGDEIKVAAGGYASLTLGENHVRLDGGADLRLDSLDASHIALSQLDGRVYHRVQVPSDGDYRVTTASVSWLADGTAFDIDRHAARDGGEEVRGLALQDAVGLAGPDLKVALEQGMSATVRLSGGASAPVVGEMTAADLADPWLANNAYLDARLGLPLGRLAALVSPSPTAEPTDEPSAEPTDEPTPTAKATAKPTAKPTANLTDLGTIGVTDKGGGNYKLTWKAYAGPIAISFYKVCFTSSTIGDFGYLKGNYDRCDPMYTPVWEGAVPAGTWRVKAEAIYYTAAGQMVAEPATSETAHVAAWTKILTLTVAAPATVNLPAFEVVENGDLTYSFSWSAYGGPYSFNNYELVYEPWSASPNPSYLHGDLWWYEASPGTTSIDSLTGLPPGNWAIRIQAVGSWGGGAYVFGQTGYWHLFIP